jgi:hypothetical protein
MKIAKLMSVVCAAGLLMLVGCNKENKASAGAVGGQTECCSEGGAKKDGCCADKANMGAVKGECSKTCSDKASMGAVAPKKDGCCSSTN